MKESLGKCFDTCYSLLEIQRYKEKLRQDIRIDNRLIEYAAIKRVKTLDKSNINWMD